MRNGDNVIEVLLADENGTGKRARERQCRTITGSITRQSVTYNNRPMTRLEVSVQIDRPPLALSGEVRFSGRLPVVPSPSR